jgi:hypothetical protein
MLVSAEDRINWDAKMDSGDLTELQTMLHRDPAFPLNDIHLVGPTAVKVIIGDEATTTFTNPFTIEEIAVTSNTTFVVNAGANVTCTVRAPSLVEFPKGGDAALNISVVTETVGTPPDYSLNVGTLIIDGEFQYNGYNITNEVNGVVHVSNIALAQGDPTHGQVLELYFRPTVAADIVGDATNGTLILQTAFGPQDVSNAIRAFVSTTEYAHPIVTITGSNVTYKGYGYARFRYDEQFVFLGGSYLGTWMQF